MPDGRFAMLGWTLPRPPFCLGFSVSFLSDSFPFFLVIFCYFCDPGHCPFLFFVLFFPPVVFFCFPLSLFDMSPCRLGCFFGGEGCLFCCAPILSLQPFILSWVVVHLPPFFFFFCRFASFSLGFFLGLLYLVLHLHVYLLLKVVSGDVFVALPQEACWTAAVHCKSKSLFGRHPSERQ